MTAYCHKASRLPDTIEMSTLILLSVLIPLSLAGVCPDPETPDSCSCERLSSSRSPDIRMTCSLVSDATLIPSALEKNEGVTWLDLIDCTLPSLPALPRRLVHLEVINSSIPYISAPLAGSSAFEGLNFFSSMALKGVRDLSDWDWSQLQDLRNIRSITIENCRLPSLSYQFKQLGGNHPWSLSVINSSLRHIEPQALGSAKLRKFVSRGNALSTLTVQMFEPAKAIVDLELVGTGISSLTNYLPDVLKDLHALHVDYPFLLLLTPSHFSSSNIISVITVEGPPGPCKCSLAYLRRYGLGGSDKCTLEGPEGIILFTMADIFRQMC